MITITRVCQNARSNYACLSGFRRGRLWYSFFLMLSGREVIEPNFHGTEMVEKETGVRESGASGIVGWAFVNLPVRRKWSVHSETPARANRHRAPNFWKTSRRLTRTTPSFPPSKKVTSKRKRLLRIERRPCLLAQSGIKVLNYPVTFNERQKCTIEETP